MKVTVNVECSPEEARAFFGLPDVRPMQENLMQEIERRMMANLSAMDPETISKTWFPMGMQGMEQWQKLFWNQMQQSMSGAASFASAVSGLGSKEPKT